MFKQFNVFEGGFQGFSGNFRVFLKRLFFREGKAEGHLVIKQGPKSKVSFF